MEHLADEAAAGADQESLLIAIKDHLAKCPHCHEHHQERLEQLENELLIMSEEKNSGQRV